MGEHSVSPPIRIIVEFSEECRVNPLMQRLWILLPRHLKTVSDLAGYLEEKCVRLDYGASAGISLEIGGVPVPLHEDIAIIRDADTVRVRVHHLKPELPAIEGLAEMLAIEGPHSLEAHSLKENRERKKMEHGGKGKEDRNVLVAGSDKEKKRQRENGDAEEGPGEASQNFLIQYKEKKVKAAKIQKEPCLRTGEFVKGGVSVDSKLSNGVEDSRRRHEELHGEGGLEVNQGDAGSLPTKLETGRKRKKRSKKEGDREEGARIDNFPMEQSGERKKEKQRRKGEDEAALEREQSEAPLQLEWVPEAATLGKGSAEGSGPSLVGLPNGKLTGKALQRGKKKTLKEAEEGNEEGPLPSVRQPPEGKTAEPSVSKKVVPREETDAEEDESSSESESGGEAPPKEKKTPSRSARRKAAKRRYARLAREAAAAGDVEAVTSGPGDTRARHNVSSVSLAVEADRSAAMGAIPARRPAASQHVVFGDSDNEEGAPRTRAANRPPIVLNVGFGASGQPLSKERGKEWGLQKGRKRDRYKDDTWQQTTGWAEVPPPEPAAAEITEKIERGAEEFRRTRTAEEYEKLPDLGRAPQVADVLAYRLVELTSSWTPQISEYREGRVTAFDAASGTVALAWWPAEDLVGRKEAVAQLDENFEETLPAEPAFAPPYDEDGNLEINLGSLMGVKLVQASEVTLAQLPGAPPVPAFTPVHITGEGSPSSVLAMGEADHHTTAEKGGKNGGMTMGADGNDGSGIGGRGNNGSVKKGFENGGQTQGSGGNGRLRAVKEPLKVGAGMTVNESEGKNDEGVSPRPSASSGLDAMPQTGAKGQKVNGCLADGDRKGERQEQKQAQNDGLEAEKLDHAPADVSRASAPAEPIPTGVLTGRPANGAKEEAGKVTGHMEISSSKAFRARWDASNWEGTGSDETLLRSEKESAIVSGGGDGQSGDGVVGVIDGPEKVAATDGIGVLGGPKNVALAGGSKGLAGAKNVSTIGGEPQALPAAGGLKVAGGPKGLGPTPPAWQAWESVAQLLARRRAEIAEQARKQEEERKREEARRQEEERQRKEGQKGEDTGKAGDTGDRDEVPKEGAENEEEGRGGELDGDGEEERKRGGEIGEGARMEGDAARMECEAAGWEERNGRKEKKEEEESEKPRNRKEKRKREEKEALTSGTHERGKSANSFGGADLEQGPDEAARSGFRCEPTGNLSDGTADRNDPEVVDNGFGPGAKAKDLTSGLLSSAALDVARKKAVESGVSPDRHDSTSGIGGDKAKLGKGLGANGVGPRGVTKPRAPRLGALGPTLAYLRSQTNELH
ncbi:hypothetical protein KFL_004200070 [Klebsormidium nitens]|uniref:Coilin tudor domain-containing protein n=1 Tax=Klebsormidium nitens TaxID=105231 RepID=A0A1Y1IH15_KLENI|nr:hypothetical protein KFL_004200070 [Klebsormidium nitens]|eukprot:GAQ88351.1 hypothetical protein KFL_004200070 [Klebsormidium nitens]